MLLHCGRVYYESTKREPKIRGINKCRCDERLQTKTKEFTRLPYKNTNLKFEFVQTYTLAMGTLSGTTVLGDESCSTVVLDSAGRFIAQHWTTVQDDSLSSTAHQRAVVHTPPISGAAATLQEEGEAVIFFNFHPLKLSCSYSFRVQCILCLQQARMRLRRG